MRRNAYEKVLRVKIGSPPMITILLAGIMLFPSVKAVHAAGGLEPGSADVTLTPGTAGSPISKTLQVPIVQPKVDLLIGMDTTGRMGGTLDQLKVHIGDMVSALEAAGATDLAIGAVNFEDYPAEYLDDPPGNNLGSMTDASTMGSMTDASTTESITMENIMVKTTMIGGIAAASYRTNTEPG